MQRRLSSYKPCVLLEGMTASSRLHSFYPSVPESRPDRPRFGVVYADPPWLLKGGVSMPYPMMRTPDICALPVRDIVDTDCLLFLWAVSSHLPDALDVIRAWGFAYRTVAFTWVKRTPKDPGYFLGRGYWTHSNAEICLLAAQGHPRRVGIAELFARQKVAG